MFFRLGLVQVGTLRLLLVLGSVLTFPAGPVRAQTLAGFAEANITPPLGIPLGGRGCKLTYADRIIDPLYLGVTVLKDSKNTTLVIASLDLPGIYHDTGEAVRKVIANTLGIPTDNVVINCSHTHSGPLMYREVMAGCGELRADEKEYRAFLADRLVESIQSAARDLKPVTLTIHQGTCQVGINRRGKTPDGRTAMMANPDGAYDPSVWVMRLASPEGATRAVLFSFACHPVTVYRVVLSGISADYPGIARSRLREALGREVHVQFLQGAAGDIGPRCISDVKTRTYGKANPKGKEIAGTDLAQAVVEALAHQGRIITPEVAATMERACLKRGTPPSKEFYEKLAATSKDYMADAARYWLDQYARGGPTQKGDQVCVGLLKLTKDDWIVYMSGEPLIEWVGLIRQWLGDRRVVVWGYTQETGSYIPVDEILKDGGYEVESSNHFHSSNPAPYAPGLNDAVRQSVMRQVTRIEHGRK